MPATSLAWLPLSLALSILLSMTVFPHLATDASGQADHFSALLLFSAMSAGFIRGVGFVPRHPALRWAFSEEASLFYFSLALLRLSLNSPLMPGI